MIGFWVVNLLIPGEPTSCRINTSSGGWYLEKNEKYSQSKDAIHNGQCAHTYTIENNASMEDGSAVVDKSLKEMTPILLGASFLSGLSVTAKTSLFHSDLMIIQSSDHWPRERSIGLGLPSVATQQDFIGNMEQFINAWSSVAQSEKILLLIHHWLDALGCWSFEDFYLSATTLLQIIAATNRQCNGNNCLSYFEAIQSASSRVGINSLSRDFKDMRNNLIHGGRLLGGRFAGTDLESCSEVAENVMNWFDEYIHAVMNLGTVKKKRYTKADFMSLNAYSL